MNMGFVTITTRILTNKNNLLSWQLLNSSHAHVNKAIIVINTAKCGTEDVA